jgi:poly-gamma-glutamate synthesis protein (capsule biosynthesis protein)
MRTSIAGTVLAFTLAAAPVLHAADLRLAFAGDIMGHDVNYAMDDYHDIYRGVAGILGSQDITFANLEFPLDPSRHFAGYPYFNGTPGYLAAAIDSGVNLFSLANNHAFDGGVEGIFQTERSLERQRADGRVLGYSGTRGNPWRSFGPQAFTVRGVRVGFIAVAQFLNQPDQGRYVHVVDYADPAQAGAFLSYVRAVAPMYDLFIVSYHGDREYVQVPAAPKRAFFRSLLEAGAHIVVGHHPHVIQEYEVVESSGARRVAMYSMGNFISGMTWSLSPAQLHGSLAATGESFLLQVLVHCGPAGCSVTDAAPVPIAAYEDEKQHMVVARLDDLADGTVKLTPDWKAYYAARLAMMKEFLGIK